MITDLNERSREIFRAVVTAYLETGEPVGSRTLSRALNMDVSAATIRNVMADLQDAGMLYAPHVSAGRIPTESGLRLFVDGMMEVGNITQDERSQIETRCTTSGQSYEKLLGQVSSTLSGLSSCAGLVMAPKTDRPICQIQFVRMDVGRILVVMVFEDGQVENRIMEMPQSIPSSALITAGNYLSDKLYGKTLSEARETILEEIASHHSQLDELTTKVVKEGLATRPNESDGYLIVRGQSNLLDEDHATNDLESIRRLMDALETKENMLSLLNEAGDAQGVRIYIGAENSLFNHSGWSMIVSPCTNSEQKVIGAIGVIGPTRINYGKIIPIVDYTSKVIGQLL